MISCNLDTKRPIFFSPFFHFIHRWMQLKKVRRGDAKRKESTDKKTQTLKHADNISRLDDPNLEFQFPYSRSSFFVVCCCYCCCCCFIFDFRLHVRYENTVRMIIDSSGTSSILMITCHFVNVYWMYPECYLSGIPSVYVTRVDISFTFWSNRTTHEPTVDGNMKSGTIASYHISSQPLSSLLCTFIEFLKA